MSRGAVQGESLDGEWLPTADTLAGASYDGRPGTIGAARDFAVAFLHRAQAARGGEASQGLVDDVRLIVSELVSNAAKFAPGPCLLDLEVLDGGPDQETVGPTLRITLWDTESALPVPSEPDASRIGAHGLEIVLALCRRFEAQRQAGGKRVRIDMALDRPKPGGGRRQRP